MAAKRRDGESWAAFMRRKKRNRLERCWCQAWWFPHRRGSEPRDPDLLRPPSSHDSLNL